MNSTLLVSFFGGPGCGKSIMAADVFAKLKWQGHTAELAFEYAKDKVYEEAYTMFDNQIYMFAKQHHRIKRVLGKTQVIVTDSPFLLGVAYIKDNNTFLRDLIVSEYRKLTTLNIFLNRSKSHKYEVEGRNQTLEESKK